LRREGGKGERARPRQQRQINSENFAGSARKDDGLDPGKRDCYRRCSRHCNLCRLLRLVVYSRPTINPAPPAITSITPSSVTAGGAGFML
jgi:hypothetical protein